MDNPDLAKLDGSDKRPIIDAAVATVAILGVAGIFQSPLLVALAMFYGPLLAAWLAKRNSVARAALGGQLGALVSLVVLVLIKKGVAARGASLLTHPENTTGIVFVGVIAIMLLALPTMLIGATVGEALARRRRERVIAISSVAETPKALSDDELARIEL